MASVAAGSRIRSAAGRSWRARSCCTEACRAVKPSKPELGGQAHDGGRAAPRLLGEVGDGAEGDELWVLEHHLGDAPLGRRERGACLADPVRHFHRAREPRQPRGRVDDR